MAVLIQALLFFTVQPEIAYDSASYMAQAESLAATGSARNALGEPDTLRTPGYPLFLAAFLFPGLGYAGAVAGQRLLWLIVVAATTWLSFRLTRRAIVAVVAGLITAIDVPALQATSSILTETLAAVLVCAAAWQAYRSVSARVMSAAVMAGLLAGAAALVRPVAILLGVALAIAIAIGSPRGHRARPAAAIVIVSLVICGSWIARNYMQTGVATFSSISSVNLLLYRAAGTLAIRDPGGIDVNIGRRQAELDAAACRAAAQRFGRDCASLPITQRATVYSGLALPIIFGDPAATAMQAGRAFVMIMFGGGANLVAEITGIAESRARLLAFGYSVPLAVLAGVGLSFWWRVDRLAWWLVVLTIAYLVVMSLGTEAYSRFRVPFLPLYAMLAGGGAAALADRWRRD
jgi:hypothetical protein